MLDFIYMGSADLFRTAGREKFKMKIFFQRDLNPHHASPRQEIQRFRLLGLAD